MRHGHISTLHIWPARRPLAASRAALLATLLPDPGDPDKRRELLRRMAGEVVEVADVRTGKFKEETRGGILHWGREREPTEKHGQKARISSEIAAFRQEIRKAFGGRAPRVLDPFAGGGAIPLEAMRLGCETVAADLNPVAWFVLRCTLHYPRLLAGQRRTLPDFALRDRDYMEAFFQSRGIRGKKALREALAQLGHGDERQAQLSTGAGLAAEAIGQADLAWHLRAWGRRILSQAKQALAGRYPTYAEFEPLRRKGRKRTDAQPERRYRRRPPEFLEPDGNGEVSVEYLNAEFDSLYLEDEKNPRWVAKPTVAYLWARTVRCGGCRAEIPLLKTRWLCKKGKKRVLLSMSPDNGQEVVFGVEKEVPEGNGSAPQRRKHDQELGAGTMSSSGATCPCCGVITAMADLRSAGRAGRLGARMTCVVIDGQEGKDYRLPTKKEIEAASVTDAVLQEIYGKVPYGLPEEHTPSEHSLGMRIPRYGFDRWDQLFTNRQLLTLGALMLGIHRSVAAMNEYPKDWREVTFIYCACALSKLTDYSSTICSWHNGGEKLGHTFARFALPMVWDYCEVNPLAGTTGGFLPCVEWVARVAEHLDTAANEAQSAHVLCQSAVTHLPMAWRKPSHDSTNHSRKTDGWCWFSPTSSPMLGKRWCQRLSTPVLS